MNTKDRKTAANPAVTVVVLVAMLSCVIGGVLAIEANKNLPLVGIISQNGSNSMNIQFPEPAKYYTYVAGSYVDWVGITGAMPVLIPYDMPRSTLDSILSQLDMFLFPGGGSDLWNDDYTPTEIQLTINYILDYAKKQNDAGKYFPVWGTCLGFQAMMIGLSNNARIVDDGYEDRSVDHVVTIDKEQYLQSKLWPKLNVENMNYVFNNGYAYYYHNSGVNMENLAKYYPNYKDELLIIGKSDNGKTPKKEFIAIVEHKKYPFFATQFHPEKNLFERGPSYLFLDRSSKTLKFTAEIIHFIISEVRSKGSPKALQDIPESIKPYFSSYQIPITVFYNDFERVYQLQRILKIMTPTEKKIVSSLKSLRERVADKLTGFESAKLEKQQE